MRVPVVGGWGEQHGPRPLPAAVTGTTGQVEQARKALQAVGCGGDHLADEALQAAERLDASLRGAPQQVQVEVVGAVEPGTVLLLRAELDAVNVEAFGAHVAAELRRISGHDRFLVIHLEPGGNIEQLDVEKLRAELDRIAAG